MHRPGLLVLFAVAVVLWLGEYARRGLWEPDEARYAYVAREMREGGHWFVPHLHGEPYPDKPPLMFWLINAASLFTGGRINGIATRLPSLLGAVMALWAVARLLERWGDRAMAWRGVGVLLTSYLFWWEGSWGQVDALLCGLEMMSLWFFFSYHDSGRAWRAALAYVFAGLAVLAKGPVGFVVPVGVYIACSCAIGHARQLRRWHWLWGTLLALSIPGAWLAVAWWQDAPRDYFAAMFGAKSFGRVIRDHHAQPFYYYLAHFPTEFLPWTLLLPVAWKALGPGALRRRLATWGLFVIGLFSLFVGKRNLYILPAYPAAAMLIAASWPKLSQLPRHWTSITAGLAVGLVALIGVVEIVAAFHPAVPIAGGWFVPAALVMLGGAIGLIVMFRKERMGLRWLWLFTGIWFAHQIAVATLVFPALNPLKAPLALAAEARQRLQPTQPIHVFRDQLAIIPLYAERPGRQLRTPDEIEALIARSEYHIVVFDREDWITLEAQFAGRVRARPFEMGNKELVWVDFPIEAVLQAP